MTWELHSDYQGWTNWETWNTKLMMDNEQGLYNGSRAIVKRFRNRPVEGEASLSNWAIQSIIGPYNRDRINEAQEWNDIPHHERLDPNLEDLRDKSEQGYNFVNDINNIFGVDPIKDEDPDIIDPNKVNWYEIFQHMVADIDEEERYEQGLPPSWQEQTDPDKPGDLTLPQGWSRTLNR